MRTNKYQYLRVLQEWVTDCGWSDSCFYDAKDREQTKSIREDVKAYREEGCKVRVISRRVPNDGRQIHA